MRKLIVRNSSDNQCESCDKIGVMFFESNHLHEEAGVMVNVFSCKLCSHQQTFDMVSGERLKSIRYW